MPIQDQLSYSLGLKTQEGNKILAQNIANSDNIEQLNELVKFINSKPHERLQMDAMLTIAYISEHNPKLVLDHIDFLLHKLHDPINRVIFGSMIALSNAAHLALDKLFVNLSQILDAMEAGTVVTKDHGFRILVSLYQEEKYSEDTFFIIIEQIIIASANQLGQYTERMIPVLKANHKKKFITTLEDRREGLSNEYHLKRLSKYLKKLYK